MNLLMVNNDGLKSIIGAMDEGELKKRIDETKNFVILSNTRINYLTQLIDGFKSRNRIIMRHEGFYIMVHRDFNRSLLLDLRALTETRDDTHNLTTMTTAVRKWVSENKGEETIGKAHEFCDQIDALMTDSVVRAATILSSTQAAHRALRLPGTRQVLTYEQASEWLKKVGTLLNELSGLLWNASTVMHMFESDGDSFIRELKFMERAELAGGHLITTEESHNAIDYADRLLEARDEKLNGQEGAANKS